MAFLLEKDSCGMKQNQYQKMKYDFFCNLQKKKHNCHGGKSFQNGKFCSFCKIKSFPQGMINFHFHRRYSGRRKKHYKHTTEKAEKKNRHTGRRQSPRKLTDCYSKKDPRFPCAKHSGGIFLFLRKADPGICKNASYKRKVIKALGKHNSCKRV